MSNMNGINRLGRVLQQRMRAVSTQPSVMDVATVETDGSLKIDTYGVTIEKNEYATLMTGEEKPVYKIGDRVVIAYTDDDIVVLGKLV